MENSRGTTIPFLHAQYVENMSTTWDVLLTRIQVALIPTSVFAQLMVNHGLGRDIWSLEPQEISDTLFVSSLLAETVELYR